MIYGRRSRIQAKDAASWGGALNQALGLEGVDNLPGHADTEGLQFVFDLNNPWGYLSSDLKGNVAANASTLVGVSNNDFGICGVGGPVLAAAGGDVIISTGPTAQQGVVNMRILQASVRLMLNAAGVAALAGKTIRFQWAEYGPNEVNPVGTIATQEVTSPGLSTFSNLQQLIGYPMYLPYPDVLVLTISTLDGTVFPAATNVRRECRVITRPPKLPLPI